jgi:hypothetical protein
MIVCDSTLHILISLSKLAEAKNLPSGENDIEVTSLL